MSIVQANADYSKADYQRAIQGYVSCLVKVPSLGRTIIPSLKRALQRYRIERQRLLLRDPASLRVGIFGWEMSHNAAGRVHSLGLLYDGLAQSKMMGFIFSAAGREVWAPIREHVLPMHILQIPDAAHLLERAIPYVIDNPLEFVHLSKPRAPNLLIGLLYKLIWQAYVVMDIDDEELGFVDAKAPISLEEYLKSESILPPLSDLPFKDWTRIAVGLATAFDGVSVANRPLQERYGGVPIAHARDELAFNPSARFREENQRRYGVDPRRKVVLFLGTPRLHKGLLDVARAIANLQDSRILFLIAGAFPNPLLKIQLEQIRPVDYLFLGNQPFSEVPGIVSLADVCVLFQDAQSTIGQFQSPAKLSDALAMGIPVLTTAAPPLRDAINRGAALAVDSVSLSESMRMVLNSHDIARQLSLAARHYFEIYLSKGANQIALRSILDQFFRQLPDKPILKGELCKLASVLPHPLFPILADAASTCEPTPRERLSADDS